MTPNPALGVFFHWLGGLASGSFYVPYRGVKVWAWETYWLVGGFFSWIIAPWVLAGLLTNDVTGVLKEAPGSAIFWSYFFGVLWGLGGLTFGLTMRYLGMSLGMAVALGYCAAFGTLMPPIFRGEFVDKVLGTHSGVVILIGIFVCLLGIGIAGLAGISKERELPEEQKRAAIKEFNLKKGVGVATFSGVMSACFSYGLAAGEPIKHITLQHGTTTLWQGLPVLIVVLLGGFTTNVIWCVALNIRNRTGYQYFTSEVRNPVNGGEPPIENPIDAPGEEVARRAKVSSVATLARVEPARAPMLTQLSPLRACRHYLVFSVLLLHHGRDADGQVRLLELDAAHGEHHHLQHALGHRAEGVERHGDPHQSSGVPEFACARRVHSYRRLWELSGDCAGCQRVALKADALEFPQRLRTRDLTTRE